jgi:putative intracellular protease/amidase
MAPATSGTPRTKGKIGVLIEDHFDPDEYREFNRFFPEKGYEVVYLTHLWNQPALEFGSNPENHQVREKVKVTTEIHDLDLAPYRGIIAIGAYAMDRLRYQVTVRKGQKNQSPALIFLRRAMAAKHLKLGTICHGLWLWCADRDLLKGRRVTCAHNIVCDVENAGADIVYEGDGTADIVVDGNLITAKHPAVNQRFMEVFVEEIEKAASQGVAR